MWRRAKRPRISRRNGCGSTSSKTSSTSDGSPACGRSAVGTFRNLADVARDVRRFEHMRAAIYARVSRADQSSEMQADEAAESDDSDSTDESEDADESDESDESDQSEDPDESSD